MNVLSIASVPCSLAKDRFSVISLIEQGNVVVETIVCVHTPKMESVKTSYQRSNCLHLTTTEHMYEDDERLMYCCPCI